MSNQKFAGTVPFKVAGQPELSKGQQSILRKSVENGSPPEELRFQCRIAQDARLNFGTVVLPNGETLKLHSHSYPQFGKTVRGHAYLTASMVYSGDGEAYTFRWVGDSVPVEMLKVAVRHDLGKEVKPATIPLDLKQAEVTPTHKAQNHPHPSERDYVAEESTRNQNRTRKRGKGLTGRTRTCARVVAADVT